MSMTLFKMHYKDFPAGAMVKNPPFREQGFDPWSGKIPLATGQRSPCATTTDRMCLEPVLCKRRSKDSEKPAHHKQRTAPLTTARESPHAAAKTQCSRQ